MGKKLEAQSIIEMNVNSESSPSFIVYDEKEVHDYNRKASLLLIALFGLKYVKSNKIRIEGNKFLARRH